MKAKLTKISENENKLRSNIIEGEFTDYPELGMSFVMFGTSLTEGSDLVRVVTTSMVQSILKIDIKVLEFKTLNSTYRLENIESFDA